MKQRRISYVFISKTKDTDLNLFMAIRFQELISKVSETRGGFFVELA